MKVEMIPPIFPRRGGEVKEGNVYTNPHGRPFYKVVIGLVPPDWGRSGRWNNVVMVHVTSTGQIVGASCQPKTYVSNHQDLVGVVKSMPTLKIEWLKENSRGKNKPTSK